MCRKQRVRLEIIQVLVNSGIPSEVIFDYADQVFIRVEEGKKPENRLHIVKQTAKNRLEK